jgi:hypothetical protein
MMNNGFVHEVAKRVAIHPALAAESSPAARTQRLFELLYGRAATVSEQERVVAFAADPMVNAPWERIAHALLMANEFLFID